MTADADRMRAALDASLRATDLADLLVQAGVPFRESHGLVGRLVREAERTGVRSEEHTSELQSPCNLVCRLLLEKKKKKIHTSVKRRELETYITTERAAAT